MLRKHDWFNYLNAHVVEILQSKDEGKEVGDYAQIVEELNALSFDDPKRARMLDEFLDQLAALETKVQDYPYVEPSDLEGIKKARPQTAGKYVKKDTGLDEKVLYDKVYGAWLGRSAGCLLGKPLECMQRDRIRGILTDTGNYPIQYYVSSNVSEDIIKKYNMLQFAKDAYIDRVSCMPEDDDINYTVLGLKLLEKKGVEFTPEDVAERWLSDLPILHLATAELIAYRNIVNRMYPPLSATYRNPYREWIGAQIRGDFFGYINPGNPELAAEMAWRDASISHIKNGIYGEMFIAAMLSWSAVCNDMEEIIDAGLSQIPDQCRLSEKIRMVLEWKRKGMNWEQAIDEVHTIYNPLNSHHAVHTISNAMIVVLGLLFGEKDFEKTIGISVMAAFDTDCNGATAGSIAGMILGAGALPEKWINPLNDTIISGVDGFRMVKISELAERTVRLIYKNEGR